ncbi:oligosaccharide flippase family protein [Candidatus Kaiserbacteria bacterium]|nr:oligosaccharide flippase family protein [Candidatus Kaiserbacteria bacterium]
MQEKTLKTLRWSERYAKTDMVEFAANNAWLFVGRMIAVGSGVVLTIAFANLLTPTAFGTYKYIIATAGFVGAFSLAGLATSGTRMVAQGHKNGIPHLFLMYTLSSIPASVITALVSIYYFYMGNAVLGFGMAFVAITNVYNGLVLNKSLFSGLTDFKAQFWYGVPRTIVPIVIMIATLFITKNLIIVFTAYFLGNLAVGWVTYVLSMRHAGVDAASENKEATREAIRFGFHMSIIGGIGVAAAQIDQLLLWHFVGPVELAIFTFAIAPIRELRGLLDNFSPIIFARFAVRTRDELRASIPLRAKQIFLVSLVITALYSFTAPYMFNIFFPQYLSAVFLSQLLALTILLQPKSVMENALGAQGETTRRYIIIAATQALKLILSASLIPLYGLNGAIAGLLLTELGTAIILAVAYTFFYGRPQN